MWVREEGKGRSEMRVKRREGRGRAKGDKFGSEAGAKECTSSRGAQESPVVDRPELNAKARERERLEDKADGSKGR